MATRSEREPQPIPGQGDGQAARSRSIGPAAGDLRSNVAAQADAGDRDRRNRASRASEPSGGAGRASGSRSRPKPAADERAELEGRDAHASVDIDRRPVTDGGRARDDGNLDAHRPQQHDGLASTSGASLAPAPQTDATKPVRASTDTSQTSETAATDGESTGTERSGVDARRRGWFWHWNNVVTQYAPLIGLKGVGLLNSYTVWTDRRDESPHRGYAFPSQQSEADFYGEDRAELITINKILVALDLIEIRKEMLTRIDERGRRWRVPHNLYRVKDRPDGVDLRAADVMRVATLAKNDAAVFRHVRRMFSERFKPIDGDNVWHTILEEVRNDPTWQELQERTRVIEERASARTKAGHKRRAQTAAAAIDESNDESASLHNTQQGVTPDTTPLQEMTTSVGQSNNGSSRSATTDVDHINTGSGVAVGGSNRASGRKQPTSAGAINTGSQSVVGPSNTTYDQRDLTTTTTTSIADEAVGRWAANAGEAQLFIKPVVSAVNRAVAEVGDWQEADDLAAVGDGAVVMGANEGVEGRRARRVVASETALDQRIEDNTEVEKDGHERSSAGTRIGGSSRERRLADPAAGGPLVDPGALVISTFEAANDRRITPLERHLLAELEGDADPAARAVGSTGADWLVAAMREAVASGSAFVAPKRIREIVTRWASDPRRAPSSAPTTLNTSSTPLPAQEAESSSADVRLPGGASGNTVWERVVDDLTRVLDADAHRRLLADSRIARYWRGTVEIHTPSQLAAEKLDGEYRGMVERHLNNHLRRPATIRFVHLTEAADDVEAVEAEPTPPAATARIEIDAAQVEIGRQVWQSLLTDLARGIGAADVDRLAGVTVLGQDTSGAFLLAATSPLARRLLEGRYRTEVELSLTALIGQLATIRILNDSEWRVTGSV